MQALSQEAAAEIEELLVRQSSEREQALLREFLAVNRRTVRPVLALSDDFIMTNDAADRSLDTADHVIVREKAADLMSARHDTTGEVILSGGQTVRLRCRPVLSPTGRAGAVVEVSFAEGGGRRHGADHRTAEPLPGLVGHSPAWLEASLQVETHCRARTSLLVEGEAGVGKLAMVAAAHRRWYGDGRFTVVDLLDPAEDLATVAVEGTLVLRHLDQANPAVLQQLAEVLPRLAEGELWVVGTAGCDGDVQRRLDGLLPYFKESVTLPPLRHRIEDVRELVPHLLQRHAVDRHISVGPEAMQTLLRVAWPGNVAELEHALRSALARRHTGQITVADLPESCHVTSRRVLSEWECLERDAIVRSLKESGGDKLKAAARLGISRATIYRKIRTFGIIIDDRAEENR
jgi:transcriptional regulator of acetoin/glycerol metabolism